MNKKLFLIDVDNTLLDNDHIKVEIKKSLIQVLGKSEAEHFWEHHDSFRSKEKLVDFPKIIHEFCHEKDSATCDSRLHAIFEGINFKHALYPDVEKVIAHLKSLGEVAIFTEGDAVYQKRKVDQSGLSKLVDSVYLYRHKLDHIDEIIKKYKDYDISVIDDRAQSLLKIKKKHPRVEVIEVCQGHYSTVDHQQHESLDMIIDSVSGLLSYHS